MADYFSSLVGRTLGKVPTVRPLVTPRYAKESWGTDTTPHEQYVERSEAASRAPKTEAMNLRRDAESKPEVRRQADAETAGRSLREAPPEHSTEFRLIGEQTTAQPYEGVSEPREPQPEPRRTEAPPAQHSNEEWRLLPLLPEPKRAEPEVRQDKPARPNEVATAATRQQEETPVIRVSIGRIDVRAVMPQAERAEPQPAQPRRSTLEKYLRARNGDRG